MVRQRAEADARTYGYYLNPDPEFLQSLLEGLKKNEERYGYPSCPCRLASGKFEFDRDIICPCDYRDPDVEEFGACYCGLYVRRDVFEMKTLVQPVPERRPLEKQIRAYAVTAAPTEQKTEINAAVSGEQAAGSSESKKKFWY
jgi:ferredoxin-thioredoxin reductase catalytic subunit